MRSITRVVFAVFVLSIGACCGNSAQPDKWADAGAKAVEDQKKIPAPAPTRTPLDDLVEKKTLADAIAYAKPRMGDNVNGNQPEGETMLILWAAKNGLKWPEIKALPETKLSLVAKDSEEERGKKFCMAGTIVEIAAVKTQVGKYFDGGVINDAMEVVRFHAFGSTGDLVQGKPAKICGVVTGAAKYGNSVGGTTHGVQIIGMFDLPENTKPATPAASK